MIATVLVVATAGALVGAVATTLVVLWLNGRSDRMRSPSAPSEVSREAMRGWWSNEPDFRGRSSNPYADGDGNWPADEWSSYQRED